MDGGYRRMRFRQNYYRRPYYTSKPSYSKGTYRKYQYSKKKSAKYAARDAQRNIVHVTKGPSPMQAYVKIKVSGLVNIALGAGAFNETDELATMNGLFTPSSFFGQQPTGFDQWSALFQRYTVLASAVKLHIANQTVITASAGSTFTQPVQPLITVTVLPTSMDVTQLRVAADSGGASGSGAALNLQNDAKAKTVMLGNPNACNTALLKHYCKIKDLYPQKNIEDEDDYSGLTVSDQAGASNPAIVPIWGIVVQSSTPQGTVGVYTTTPTVFIQATITFYTKFSSPVNLYDS